jgi:hypothetical protein
MFIVQATVATIINYNQNMFIAQGTSGATFTLEPQQQMLDKAESS